MSPDEAAARARHFIATHWRGRDDSSWRDAVVLAGWAAPTWPTDAWGLGLSAEAAESASAVFADAGAPGSGRELGVDREDAYVRLAGRPIVEYGSRTLKEGFLRDLLAGERGRGCLLYSEPGAGSDLASLRTRAVAEGDEYVVNGHKIWTTRAREAKFGLLLARTDVDVPKHQGLSFFLLPMDQPGVRVEPLRQMTGDAEFNEVFLTDARVSRADMIGEPGQGWKVLQVALAAERSTMGARQMTGSTADGRSTGSVIFDAAADLLALARDAGADTDPIVRQEVARILSWRAVNNWTSQRARSAASGTSSHASLSKLAMSRILHRSQALRFRLLGSRALQYDETADPIAYEVDYALMKSFINSIGGGSDQIQRNIIAERVLGLPKSSDPDKGLPFRDVLLSPPARSL